jgi:hypothetical protein
MARPKSDNPRKKNITVWVSEKEKKDIELKGKMAGLKASEYLRSLGCNYPLKSMVDQLAVDELIQARSDLGRLGGLFKKWLSDQEGRSGNIGSRSYEDINKIVGDLEVKQKQLLEVAYKIMKGIK